ncbi:dihydroxy-acid dehydratase, partial [Streptosporangium vulgare]|uniref:dihydroxy-acid dehydratase domain-containing protein n=1 Tax=Streptosporangium vulgare TaxID=46190 RepID=UPI003CD05F6E
MLRGTLAPGGAVIKTAAASPHLMNHTGPALVVDSAQEAQRILDDPDLDVTPDHVLVLRNAGPIAAGMPEAGALPIPAKLARAGLRDMVRVSD